jgi:hypothetical protein
MTVVAAKIITTLLSVSICAGLLVGVNWLIDRIDRASEKRYAPESFDDFLRRTGKAHLISIRAYRRCMRESEDKVECEGEE